MSPLEGDSQVGRDLSQGQEAVEEMVRRAGLEYSESDRDLMLVESEELRDETMRDRLSELFDAAGRGFWHCAADGYLFVDPRIGADEFAEELRETYPDASPAFIDLAASYWSLKVLSGQMETRFSGVGVQQVLTGIEERVRKLFFQDPETALRSIPKLEEAQREAIEVSGAPIDAEQLIGGNPEDRKVDRLPGFLRFLRR